MFQIALLIDIVKEKVFPRNLHEVSNIPNNETGRPNKIKHIVQPIWCLNALELIGFILKPHDGGPPSLPEHNEAVSFLRFRLYCAKLLNFLNYVIIQSKFQRSLVLSRKGCHATMCALYLFLED